MSHAAPEDFLHNDGERQGGSAPPPPPSDGSIPVARAGEHVAGPAHAPAHALANAVSGTPLAAPNHAVPDVEALLIDAIEIIETARPAPLSTSIKLEGEPLLDLLYDARERLPDELRAARWLLRDRDEFLETQRIEGEEIIAAARSRAEYLVERTEVVRSAEQRAQRIITEAKTQARQMRRETEDFCDSRLASLEATLDRTRTVVATGRARLQGAEALDLTDSAQRDAQTQAQISPGDEYTSAPSAASEPASTHLFDQDSQ